MAVRVGLRGTLISELGIILDLEREDKRGFGIGILLLFWDT